MLKLLATLAVTLAVSQVATMATTVYLHRALAHRALTVRSPLALFFRTFIWLSTGMKPREWVAVHRKHHAFTDTAEDPHSPAVAGWLRVQLTNAAMYRRAARDPRVIERYAKDLPADRWDRLFFDRAFLGLGIGVALLIVVLGPWFGLLAAVLHTGFYLWIGGAVNGLGHHFGRRPFENSATNMQWLAWLTGGEGLHNNHHAAPTSARFSHRRGEFDLGWLAIRVFRRLGLAKVRLEELKVLAKATAGKGRIPA